MKKLLLSALLLLSIGSVNVSAEERMTKDDRVEIHLECIMHPVLTGTDIKQNPYTKQEYEIMTYYDAVTGYRINTEVETIYMDNEDNRWYFPYDGTKFHYHEEVK